MYIIILTSLVTIIVLAGVTAVSLLSGVGLLLAVCLKSIFCVIAGAGMLIKLLGKGIFSLLKCVVFLGLMVIPAVNVIALIIAAVCLIKAMKNET